MFENFRVVGRECLEKVRPILDPAGIESKFDPAALSGAMFDYAARCAINALSRATQQVGD